MLTNRQEIAFFCCLGGILVTFFALAYFFGFKNINKEEIPAPQVQNPFDTLSLTAKSVFVYDLENEKILYAKNENERLPLASVTKVMSALIASEVAPLESVVTVGRDALLAEGDAGLLRDERWLLKDLLDFSLVTSANDGMRAIALNFGGLQDFIEKMNRKASEIGLLNTYYFNEHGLDESIEKGGAYGSARDQAMLFAYILKEKPFLLVATREQDFTITSLSGITHLAQNTNGITGNIPGLIASKTGFTDLAGGNLVIAWNPEIGRPIIIAVLGSTVEGRFSDVLSLIEASFTSIQEDVILER